MTRLFSKWFVTTCLVVFAFGCAESSDEGSREQGSATNDAAIADTSTDASTDAALATATMAAADAPSISITSPINNTDVAFVPQGANGSATSVLITVSVDNVTVAAGQHFYNVYVDGEFYVASTSLTSAGVLVVGLPTGRRHIAVELSSPDGNELTNPEAMDSIYVRVTGTCAVSADCDDGLSCSIESCNPGSLTCGYGPIADCCDQDKECPNTWFCDGGTCKECQDSAACDDGNACTNDFCEPSTGLCEHFPIEDCCYEDADCDDGLFCTSDSCDGSTCVYEQTDDVNCCDTDADCVVDDPCIATTCYKSASKGIQVCRVGPADPECCTADSDCDDGNLCTLDTCYVAGTCDAADVSAIDNGNIAAMTVVCLSQCTGSPNVTNCTQGCLSDLMGITAPCSSCFSDLGPCIISNCASDCLTSAPGAACAQCAELSCGNVFNTCTAPGDGAGSCSYVPNPDEPDCCVDKGDCDDGNPFTIDQCVDNFCRHINDETHCELPERDTLVINEIMAAPGPISDDLGEWIEIYNPTDAFVTVDGFVIETTTNGGESHTVAAPGLDLAPGGYLTFGRHLDNAIIGFTPHYAYGLDINLPDPQENEGDVTCTITLTDKNGVVHDTLTYDSTSWPMIDGRSMERRNPYQPGATSENWRAAGTSPETSKNVTYGPSANKTFGSPRMFNNSSFLGILAPTCVLPEGSSVCTEARCDLASYCIFPEKENCCVEDEDCSDGNPCTERTCLTDLNQCTLPTTVENCCLADSDCVDDNACNLDRCMGARCRYSDNVVPDCCYQDSDCEDGDICTVNICDTDSATCDPAIPADADCCASDSYCDDGDPATLNLCNMETNLCEYPPDPEHCTDVDAPCDDGNPCTQDYCQVGPQLCAHDPIDGCCLESADCPADDNACTEAVCFPTDNTCGQAEVPACCAGIEDCDDANPCTDDFCNALNKCHHRPVDGCCVSDSECNDGDECTTDICNLGSCFNSQVLGCCTPGESQGELAVSCGPTTDECDLWECTSEGACSLDVGGGCCESHDDCDDANSCTLDFCQAGNKCKSIPLTTGGCCASNFNCGSGEYCDLAINACIDKLGLGEVCVGDQDCETSVCALGLCSCPAGFEGPNCEVPVCVPSCPSPYECKVAGCVHPDPNWNEHVQPVIEQKCGTYDAPEDACPDGTDSDLCYLLLIEACNTFHGADCSGEALIDAGKPQCFTAQESDTIKTWLENGADCGPDGVPCDFRDACVLDGECDNGECIGEIPCVNGGDCELSGDAYFCDCPAGYSGTDCEIDIDDCADETDLGTSALPNTGQNTLADIVILDHPATRDGCVSGVTMILATTPVGNGAGWEARVYNMAGSTATFVESRSFAVNTAIVGGKQTIALDTENDCLAIDEGQFVGITNTNGDMELAFASEGDGYFYLDTQPVGDSVPMDRAEGGIAAQVQLAHEAPCKNGATCEDLLDEYVCTCAAGYEGVNCDIDSDNCNPNPCQNGGLCSDSLDGYTCACPAGFTGDDCEFNEDECQIAIPTGADALPEDNASGAHIIIPLEHVSHDGCVQSVTLRLGDTPAGDGTQWEVGAYYTSFGFARQGDTQTIDINPTTFDEQTIGLDPCLPVLEGQTVGIANPDGATRLTYTKFGGEGYLYLTKEPAFTPNQSLGLNTWTGDAGFRANIYTPTCLNGAECIDGADAFECVCDPGYEGVNCEVDIDECAPEPCQNGGICTDLVNDYSCECLPGYTGDDCEIDVNGCEFAPCLNGATCADITDDYVCECDDGYSGKNCQIDDNNCASHSGVGPSELPAAGVLDDHLVINMMPVSIDGCVDSVTLHLATGSPGAGANWSVGVYNVDSTSGSDAVATLVDSNDLDIDNADLEEQTVKLAHCMDVAQGQFIGLHNADGATSLTRFDLAPSTGDGYGFWGLDVQPEGDDVIVSNQMYSRAGFRANLKHPVLCQNGGVCVDLVDNYSCVCPAGFNGYNCENDINDCANDPCLNGAICHDHIDSYSCTCPDGFEGFNCEINIDECAAGSCLNGSTCEDLIFDYFCHCPDGFEGKDCEVNIDECVHGPCENGSTCEDLVFDYFCHCPDGFEGKDCEINIDDCDPDPCNESVCVDLINDYYCECKDGFIGEECEINANECADEIVYGPQDLPVVNVLLDDLVIYTNPAEDDGCVTELDIKLATGALGGGTTYELRSYEAVAETVVLKSKQSITLNPNLTNPQAMEIEPCLPVMKGDYIGIANTAGDLRLAHLKSGGSGYWAIAEAPSAELNGEPEAYEHREGDVAFKIKVDYDFPCRNGSTCVDAIDGFSCVCLPGFEGDLCETQINECDFGCETGGGASGTPVYSDCCYDGSGELFAAYDPETNDNPDVMVGRDRVGCETGSCEAIVCEVDPFCCGKIVDPTTGEEFDLDQGYWDNTCVSKAELLCGEGDSTGLLGDDASVDLPLGLCSVGPICGDGKCNGSETCTSCPADCSSTECVQFGVCIDEINDYSCVCPDGITGDDCEIDIDECADAPCQNGSTCVDLVNDYYCICPDGYQGKDCEIEENECLTLPCLNGSTCTDLVFDYECTCPEGFSGKNCESDIDECAVEPCQNGATCNDLIFDYSCSCPPGFTGKDCEIDIDECALDTDLGAAATPDSGASGDSIQILAEPALIAGCIDTLSFTLGGVPSGAGSGWEVRVYAFDELEPAVKSDLGRLVASQALPAVGVTQGAVTEVVVDPCLPIAAFQHVGIYNPNGSLRVGVGADDSTGGYWHMEGAPSDQVTDFDDIDSPLNPAPDLFLRAETAGGFAAHIAHEAPCQNGATCNDQVNSYTCTCPGGFSGFNCDANEDECALGCESGNDAPGTAVWSSCCDEIQGDSAVADRAGCDVPSCEDSVCDLDPYCCGELGGYWDSTCVAYAEDLCGALCTSAPVCGDGVCNGTEDCETCEADCLSTECRNGATCVDGDFDYTCECADGFVNGDTSGQKDCEIDLDDCSPDPCVNGTCVDRVDAFACICPTGFTGNLCQVNVNDCEPNPCQNGGNCVDGDHDYSCICEDGFDGKSCENNIDDCASNPCLNGSECTDLVDDYYCACPGGFQGKDCENNVNECGTTPSTNPCLNGGICTDGVDTYVCDCPDGFEGTNCEINIDECVIDDSTGGVDTKFGFFQGQPCLNGSVCTDLVYDFECACADGFSGKRCEINDDECDPNPCKNGSACEDKIYDYMCHCLDGYEGKNCEIDQDECEPSSLPADHPLYSNIDGSYCTNGSVCTDLVYDYACACPPGFSGKDCDIDIDDCAPPALESLSVDWAMGAGFADIEMPVGSTIDFDWEGVHNVSVVPSAAAFDACDTSEASILGASESAGSNSFQFAPTEPGTYYLVCTIGSGGHCASGMKIKVEVNQLGPCINGSSCVDLVDDYHCVCPDGIVGQDCEVDADECLQTELVGPQSDFPNLGASFADGMIFMRPAELDGCIDQLTLQIGNLPNGGGAGVEVRTYSMMANQATETGSRLVPFNGNLTNIQTVDVKPCLPVAQGEFIGLVNTNGDLKLRHDAPGTGGVGYWQSLDAPEDGQDWLRVDGGSASWRAHVSYDFPCDNGSSCNDDGVLDDYNCVCTDGFSGKQCRNNDDDCSPNPCQNDGLCIDEIAGYQCKCAPGFEGTECQTNINDCDPNPCQNLGVCTDLVDDYSCECLAGYDGKNCQTDIDECADEPCLNGGTCIDLVGDYNCDCAPGFAGDSCETNIDECATNPCDNGALCIDGVNSFSCACDAGFSGTLCETNIDECALESELGPTVLPPTGASEAHLMINMEPAPIDGCIDSVTLRLGAPADGFGSDWEVRVYDVACDDDGTSVPCTKVGANPEATLRAKKGLSFDGSDLSEQTLQLSSCVPIAAGQYAAIINLDGRLRLHFAPEDGDGFWTLAGAIGSAVDGPAQQVKPSYGSPGWRANVIHPEPCAQKVCVDGVAGVICDEYPCCTQPMIITGVIDGDSIGGHPKGVELFVCQTIADLSEYSLGSANNGGGTDGPETSLPALSAMAGSRLYVGASTSGWFDYFGLFPDHIDNALSVNGNDAVELFHNGVVIDTFGDPDVNGSGTAWDYTDGYAYRLKNTGPNEGAFEADNWVFGKLAFDGLTSSEAAGVVATTFGEYSCGASGDCQPSCEGKQCGDDGCFGSCGECGPANYCDADGQCQCIPDCAGKVCGDDGCGSTCGECPEGSGCDASGQCTCVPNCDGKVCGDDGCGGSCGACPLGTACNADGAECQAGACNVTITMDTGSFGSEVSWEILDGTDSVVLSGSGYGNFQAYTSVTLLNNGSYQLRMVDGYGDGWNGGQLTIAYSNSGEVITTAGLPTGTQAIEYFEVNCSTCAPACDGKACGDNGCGGTCGECSEGACIPAEGICATGTCQVSVEIYSGTFGSEVSWALVNAQGEVIISESGYSSSTTTTHNYSIDKGEYTFKMYDSYGDGWNGGTAKVSYTYVGAADDLVLFDGGLSAGAEGEESFVVNCAECEPQCPDNAECGDDGCGGICGSGCSSDQLCVVGGQCASGTCSVSITVSTANFGGEVSWQLNDADNNAVASVASGTYGDNTSQTTTVEITAGSFSLELNDSFGDGWNGATISIVHTNSGEAIFDGTLAGGNSESFPVGIDCEGCAPMCDGLDCGSDGCGGTCGECGDGEACMEGICEGGFCDIIVTVNTGSYAYEVAWDLLDAQGVVLASSGFNTYSNSSTYTSSVQVQTGALTFKMYDSWGDGWNGGTYTITYADTGLTLDSGGLTSGTSGSSSFASDCDPCIPSCDGRVCGDDGCGGSCGDCPDGQGCTPDGFCAGGECSVTVRIDTGAYGNEVGWELVNDGGEVVASKSGYYGSYTTYTTVVTIGSGSYNFVMTDSWGDGWNGGTATIYHTNTGVTIANAGLAGGNYGVESLNVDCSACTPTCTGNCGPDGCGGQCGVCDDGLSCADGTCVSGCNIVAQMSTGNYGSEVGWSIVAPAGGTVLTGSGYGSYNDYSSTFAAENGTYTLNMTDSWGDGWNGGYLTLSYENGGSVGTFELGYGTSGTESFTVSCP